MNRFFKKADSGIEMVLGGMGLLGIIIMTVGIITRNILKISLAWSDEFLRTMFVWAYFIGGAMMYSSGGLMHLELMDDFLHKHHLEKFRTAVCILVEALLGIFYGLMAYFVYIQSVTYAQKGTTSSTSTVPAWVLIAGMGIGFVLLVCFSVRNIIRHLRKKPDTAEQED